MGGPGSGKGTQCDRLKRTLGLTHISSGDLLREEVARGTPRGQEMLAIMQRGELVPMESVLEMIRDAMIKAVLLKDAKGEGNGGGRGGRQEMKKGRSRVNVNC